MKTFKEVAEELYRTDKISVAVGITDRFQNARVITEIEMRTPEDIKNLREYVKLFSCRLEHSLCVVRDMLDKDIYRKEMSDVIDKTIFIESFFSTMLKEPMNV